MNNERAIELLHRLQDEQFDGPHGDERREALEMAVRTLSGDGDIISRQAAIELIHNLYPSEPIMRRNRERWKERYRQYIEVEEALERLPSAQPELIEQGAYVRGFEQGRTQGMIDAKEGKK